mgnify:CR=1 FL=1
MIHTRIFVDNLAYKGVDTESLYSGNMGGDGWHSGNNHEIEKIIIEAGEAKQIIGIRNLKSEIERIARRLEHGRIKPGKITILFDSI